MEQRPDPRGLNDLRQAIRDRFLFEQPPESESLITSGGRGAFATVLDAFVNPGDRVAVFDPSSPLFPVGLKHRRARIQWIPSKVENGRIRTDWEQFRRAIRGCKLLIVNDPHNPTGACFAPEDLEPLAFWANKYGVLVYFDASFCPLRYSPARPRFASLPHLRNRCLTVGSLSSSHGLTGSPVGWILGCDSLVRACTLSQALQVSGPSVHDQRIALKLLEESPDRSDFASELSRRAGELTAHLTRSGLKPTQPSAGYFLWVEVNEPGRDFARRLLVEKRVLVQSGHLFGPSGERFVRISFGLDAGRLEEGISRIESSVCARTDKSVPIPDQRYSSRIG